MQNVQSSTGPARSTRSTCRGSGALVERGMGTSKALAVSTDKHGNCTLSPGSLYRSCQPQVPPGTVLHCDDTAITCRHQHHGLCMSRDGNEDTIFPTDVAVGHTELRGRCTSALKTSSPRKDSTVPACKEEYRCESTGSLLVISAIVDALNGGAGKTSSKSKYLVGEDSSISSGMGSRLRARLRSGDSCSVQCSGLNHTGTLGRTNAPYRVSKLAAPTSWSQGLSGAASSRCRR